ncbi:MAG: signal peptidase I, partial [Peptococcaceae bacterium]|nr:signal peptidase I [Peptococcaceae bacterium]
MQRFEELIKRRKPEREKEASKPEATKETLKLEASKPEAAEETSKLEASKPEAAEETLKLEVTPQADAQATSQAAPQADAQASELEAAVETLKLQASKLKTAVETLKLGVASQVDAQATSQAALQVDAQATSQAALQIDAQATSLAAPQATSQAAPKAALRKPSASRPSIWKDLLFLVTKVASIALIFVLLFTFLYGIVRYPDPSMAPAIKDGDLVLYYHYNSVGYLPQDVIVLEHNGRSQVRRVIATAGDTVDITDGGLVINGALQQEIEIYQKTERYTEGVSFPLTVPEGQVFVLGDNRQVATDSRIYGCVKIEDTFGKVMTVIR